MAKSDWKVVGQDDEERRTNEICQDAINRHQYNSKAYMKECFYYGVPKADAKAFRDDVMARLDAGDANPGDWLGCLPMLWVTSWFVVPLVIIAITIYYTIYPKIVAVFGNLP
jgi:hypothetical protein